MVHAELKPPRRTRLGVAVLVALLHLAAAAVLVRAFAPDLSAAILEPAVQAFDVAISPPQAVKAPKPKPVPPHQPHERGSSAPAGRQADPRAISAPHARVVLAPVRAPPVAASGNADQAGASAAGQGTGSGEIGQGLGAGASGDGTGGGGGAAKPVKIAGDIISTRDYPAANRESRLGSAVTIVLTVNRDGRVGGCRVARPSRDPDADRITCRLATERFRFRPARDAAGNPIEAAYGWQQRWFAPVSK